MTKPLRLIATALTLLLLFAACGTNDDSGGGTADKRSDDGVPEALADGTLTVCTDLPYAPFEFTEDGETKGIDIDLLRAIGDELDVEVEFRDTEFDGIFAALAAGQCEVIASSVSITEERKENNLFSDGYFEINQSMLVAKDDADAIKDLADLKGKTVGVQSVTTGAAFAEEHAKDNGYTVKDFPGADDAFTALKAKQIAAIIQDYPVNAYEAEKSGASKVVKVFTDTEKESYGIVIPKGQTDLQAAVNKALQALRDNGTYDKVISTYLGADASAG